MAFTQSDLDAIDAAIKAGVSEVRYQDRTVKYQSIKDMMEARTLIVTELNVGAQTIRQSRVYTDRGW